MKKAIFAVLPALFIALAVTMCDAKPQTGKRVAEGTWGGNDIRLEVTRNGATLELSCSSGEVIEPLQLDANGQFRVKGTFSSQGPGPSREPDPNNPNAVYSGDVKGTTMRLEIQIGGEKQTYTLERGKKTKILDCK